MKKTLTHIGFLLILACLGFYQLLHPQSSTAENNSIEIPKISDTTLIRDRGDLTVTPTPPPPPASVPAEIPQTPAPIPTPTPTPPPPPPPASVPKSAPTCHFSNFNNQFLCLLNLYRQSKNLNTLTYNLYLNAAALGHATWMNTAQTMSHEGANGSKFYERCQAAGLICDAENVARGYVTPQGLLDAWIASPSHNKNLLGQHTIIGLSLVGAYADLVMR